MEENFKVKAKLLLVEIKDFTIANELFWKFYSINLILIF